MMKLTLPKFICLENNRKIHFLILIIGFLIIHLTGLEYYVTAQDYWMRHHIAKINAPICVQIADMNDDGFKDVVVAGRLADLIRWYSNPFWALDDIGVISDPQFLEVADLDQDGDLDVVVSSGGSEAVVWFEYTPSGWVKEIIDDSILVGIYGAECLEMFDLSGDDTLDVVASGNQIVWFEWPDWTPHIIDPEPGGPSGGCSYLYISDINGDLIKDLVAGNWSDPASVVPGNLVWYDSMKTKKIIATDLGVSYGIACGDLDNDGDTDIAASSWGRNWVKWYENQDPIWISGYVDSSLNNALGSILVDADQDGDLDIVAGGNFNPGWVGWYRNNNLIWEKTTIGELTGTRSLAIGDIDGDPYLDLVACGHGADSIVWYQNPFITSIFDHDDFVASEPLLLQNYPNPFNPSTTFAFYLPKSSEVSLKIYNIVGEEVATLLSGSLLSGSYSVEWDAYNLASGVYLCKFQVSKHVQTKKMLLLK